MTDKEIIIDGVDVCECSYYSSETYPYTCEVWDNECEAQNCYYKQLKRLEQENAELKVELQKYKDMEAKGLGEFKDVGGCWGCGLQLQLNQDLEDIKQLKAENERLKEELGTKEIQLANTEFDLHFEETKTSNLKQEITELATTIEKIAKIVEGTYEALDSQALQEIRQIIKEQTNERNK